MYYRGDICLNFIMLPLIKRQEKSRYFTDVFLMNGIAILEIDTDMLDKTKLTVDENNLDCDTFQYDGIIIPEAITVKSVLTAF